MMRLLERLCLIALGCGLTACDFLSPDPVIRYRLTVAVDTPDGVRSNSGVWEFKLRPGGIAQAFNARFRGEAIPVDLPNGKTVFALVDRRGINNTPVCCGGMIPETVLPQYLAGGRFPAELEGSRVRHIEYLKKHVRGTVQLNCTVTKFSSECPLLVTFDDLRDPTSVRAIDPQNVAESVGAGYGQVRVYMRLTDEAPTHQMEGRLPWEEKFRGKHLDGSGSNRPTTLQSQLGLRSFKQWDK